MGCCLEGHTLLTKEEINNNNQFIMNDSDSESNDSTDSDSEDELIDFIDENYDSDSD